MMRNMLTKIILFVIPSMIWANSFQEVLLGRCEYWKSSRNLTLIDCDNLWKTLRGTLTGKQTATSCPMSPSTYTSFVKLLFSYDNRIPKPYFWSGTRRIAEQFCVAGGACTTLEATFAGSMMNYLDWCIREFTSPDTYNTYCGCNGRAEVVLAFWKSVSLEYASLVRGNTSVLLNASYPTPFRVSSIFRSVEMPQLRAPNVKRLTAYLIYPLNQSAVKATCKEESMLELKAQAESQGLEFHCVENPAFGIHHQCAYDPTQPACRLVGTASTLHASLWTLLFLTVFITPIMQ